MRNKQIPRETMSFQKNNSSSSSTCVICWENLDLNAGEFVNNKLPCNHVFHENCIYPWLCRNDTCPLCRYKFPNEEVKWRRTIIPDSQLPWMMRSSTIAAAQPQAPVNWWTIRSYEMGMVPGMIVDEYSWIFDK